MEVSPFFAGAGVIGLATAWALGVLLLLVIPVLAIADCAATDRHRGSRGLVILLLLLSWSLGGLIYALLFPGWRWLRGFALLSLVGLVVLAVLSTASCVIGAKGASERSRQQRDLRLEEAFAAFEPRPVPLDSVGRVTAVLRVGDSVSAAEWTLAGPDHASARPVDSRVRHLAVEPGRGRTFALTDHEFGIVTPSTGSFTPIGLDSSLEPLSWPQGVAYVGDAGPVVVMTSHVYTRFYTYDPDTADWRQLPAEHRDLPIQGLAWSTAEESLYALGHDSAKHAVATLYRFNLQGALTGIVPLAPPVPVAETPGASPQLQAAGGSLVLILPADPRRDGSAEAAVLAVDPVSGVVSRARRPAEAEEP